MQLVEPPLKQVRAINKEPSSLGERKALGRLLNRMSALQRYDLLRKCCEHAISLGKVYKKDGDYSTGAVYNDLVSLTVLYGVSWETINLTAEAVYKGQGRIQ